MTIVVGKVVWTVLIDAVCRVGWWHSVTSTAGTAAVNLWYIGLRKQLCETRMAPYYLRMTLEHLAQEVANRTAQRAEAELQKTGFSGVLDDLLSNPDQRRFQQSVEAMDGVQALLLSKRLELADNALIEKLFEAGEDGSRCKGLLLQKTIGGQQEVVQQVLMTLGMAKES